MDWTAIKYVSSGLTLAAFTIASLVWLAARALGQIQHLIENSLPKDRAKVATVALERFHV